MNKSSEKLHMHVPHTWSPCATRTPDVKEKGIVVDACALHVREVCFF